MKLRNKKTGEILGSLGSFIIQNPNHINCEAITKYESLAELNEEWEDYEETEWYWFNDWTGFVSRSNIQDERANNMKEIGNHFETREDAEKAVEKLKAWKRLKDKGFKFLGINEDYTRIPVMHRDGRRYLLFNKSEDEVWLKENWKDLYLLFGGEE